MQIDLATAITVGIFILGIIGGLIKVIRDGDQKKVEETDKANAQKIKELEDKITEINNTYTANIPVVQTQIANLQTQIQSLNNTVEDLRKTQNKLSENLADTREAVAGFGASYITRRECHEQYQNKPK
jgi:septal ring factor EnvC (AmiA/AmiB activator)